MGDQNIVATFNIPASFQEPNKNPTNGTTNHSNELIGGPPPPVTSIVTAAPIVTTTATPAPISTISTPISTTKSWSGNNPPNSTVKNNNANNKGAGGNNTNPNNSSNSKKNKKKQQQFQLQQQQQEEEDGIKKRRKTWAPEEQKYACDKCNFRSAYASSLGRHRASSHKSDSTTKDVNESSSGSTNSSTPAPAVTPTPPTPTATPTPTPITATILTIPKVEVPMQVHAVAPIMEDVNFRHQPPPPQHHAPLTYEYHGSSSSSTFQDVVNTPPVYNTSVRFEPNDGIPITLMEQTNYNSLSHNESEYLPFQKSEEEMATIRAEPTVLTTLSTLAVPVNDIITLPPQSTNLTPLTSAENNRETITLNPDGTQRKRPLMNNAKSKGEDNAGGVATKKRKKEENAPTFTVLGGPSLPNNQGNKAGPPSTSPPKRPKKKKTAGNNQGAVTTGNANSGNIKSESSMSNFSNSSNSGFSRGKSDDKGKNGDGEGGGKKKRQKRKPSDKPSNPCMITSTSSSCPVCNFTTKYQFNLARHFQATHKTELQAILDGTKSFPGIRKREIREKTPKTKPKPEKKAKRPPPSAGNEQGNHNSQYSGNQREPRTLSVAQEFEQFVRDENLEMFAEADNLDFSEPMVSSFIESLFSTDMGNEGWNNVNNHGVVLNPSVHPQTIATTATYIHPQPTSGLQAVGQGSYVTTVDLLPTHPTQTQVVGNFIQPQLYSEFQKPPHSNPIQANVVINGVTTTMDLNVIEKNARQLHSQPENPPHQSQSKVFIAQSLESHSGVALELNCPPQYEVQSNGFRGQVPTTRASMPDHQQQHQQHQQTHHKWISLSQPQNTSTPGVGGNNVDIQWGGNVFQIQGSSYQGNPTQPQYHNPEMVTEVRAVELGGVDNSYLYTSWQPQQPNSTIQQQIPVTQHTQGFSVIPQQSIGVIKTEMNVGSSLPVEPTVSPVSTVDTSFLHAAIADKSHLTNLPHGTPAAKDNVSNQPSLVNSNQSIPKPPSRSKEQIEADKEAARKLRLEKRREKYKLAAERKKGTQPNTEPTVKVETKPVEETPPPTPTTAKKTRVDVEALPPEEREKRQRYLQKRRERWKAAQEKKKLLKQESDSLSGHPSSNSASISGSDSNISPAGLASSASISFLDASNSDSVKQSSSNPPTLSLPPFSMQRLPYPVVPGENNIPQGFQPFSVHTLPKLPNQSSLPNRLPTPQFNPTSFSPSNFGSQVYTGISHQRFPAPVNNFVENVMTDGIASRQVISPESPAVALGSSSTKSTPPKLTQDQLELRRQKQREYKKRKREEKLNLPKFVPSAVSVAAKSKKNKREVEPSTNVVKVETIKGPSTNFPGTWGLLGGMPQSSTYALQTPVQPSVGMATDFAPQHHSHKVGPYLPLDSSQTDTVVSRSIAMSTANAVVEGVWPVQHPEGLPRDGLTLEKNNITHTGIVQVPSTSTGITSYVSTSTFLPPQQVQNKRVQLDHKLSDEEKRRIRRERATAVQREKRQTLAKLKHDMEQHARAAVGAPPESNLNPAIESTKSKKGKSSSKNAAVVGSVESPNFDQFSLPTNIVDRPKPKNSKTKLQMTPEAQITAPFDRQTQTGSIAKSAELVSPMDTSGHVSVLQSQQLLKCTQVDMKIPTNAVAKKKRLQASSSLALGQLEQSVGEPTSDDRKYKKVESNLKVLTKISADTAKTKKSMKKMISLNAGITEAAPIEAITKGKVKSRVQKREDASSEKKNMKPATQGIPFDLKGNVSSENQKKRKSEPKSHDVILTPVVGSSTFNLDLGSSSSNILVKESFQSAPTSAAVNLLKPNSVERKTTKPMKPAARKQDVECTGIGVPVPEGTKVVRKSKKRVDKPLTEAELKKIVKLGSDDLKIPCEVTGCSFVGNTHFEMDFHLSCHNAVGSLPPFLKSIVEATGEVPKMLELRPSPGALLDNSTPSPENDCDSSSDVSTEVDSTENEQSEDIPNTVLPEDTQARLASETAVMEI